MPGESLDTRTDLATVESSDEDLAVGAGVEVRLRSAGLRLEYERFNDVGDDDLEALSLSVTWTFD